MNPDKKTPRGKKLRDVAKQARLTPAGLFDALRARTSADWSRAEQKHLLALFKRMALDVPAYRRFLREHGVRRAAIRTAKDLASTPVMAKKNYLHSNKIADLLWRGAARTPQVLTSTSGSTGKPTYFARSHAVDEQSSLIHELIFSASSLKKNKPTLVIVCFGMGVWIGGLITYQAFELMSRRGYPFSIITPGINKPQILKILTDLVPHHEQIILAGYPPFLKDVIDEALAGGISFDKRRVKLLFAAEAFTENFRDHLVEKAGVGNALTDAVNIYGSADLGTMAFETPLSILARRLAMKNKKLFADIFGGTTKTPTLAQYVPEFVSFEARDGEILISGDSALPLMRYSIGDHGGVYTFDALVERYKAHGLDLMKEARAAGIRKHACELPFVYIYERADFSVKLYGGVIYPEYVKKGLLDPAFEKLITGRFTMEIRHDAKHNEYLEIHIELKHGAKNNELLRKSLIESIVKNLSASSSEYRNNHASMQERVVPHIVFWPYEHPKYFNPGTKQKWAIRS